MQLLLTYVVDTCPCCGRPILYGEETFETVDGDVCRECRNERYTECEDCGEVVRNDDVYSVCDREVCEGCRDENYAVCAYCGDWECKDDMIWADFEDDYICEHCYDRHYIRCECCNEIVRETNSYSVENSGYVCGSCYDEYYFTCSECYGVFHRDYECYDEEHDRSYCEHCHENRVNQRNCIFSYHHFPSDNYGRRFSYCDSETERARGLTFGVELECDNGCFDIGKFEKWTDDGWLVHFEHDGSLSSRGVECITQPCTLKFHQNEMNWSALCDAFIAQGFSSHRTDTCGLHIHIGRQNLPPSVITKIDVFVNDADRFFGAIARRPVFYSSRYVPGKKLSKSKCNRYGTCDDRYQAVNTTNRKTVEIRIFRGTLKSDTIVGTIEMVHALIGFLCGIPMKDVKYTDDNILAFIGYCADHDEMYPHVIPMFRRLLERAGNCSEYLEAVNVGMAKIDRKNKRKELKKCA